jgi:predicted small metal-binding protein
VKLGPHAAHDHGITEVSPELAAKVKAAIKS